ncbi:MAG: hypothetical protein QOC92_3602 [Acidimicrobiaceae bacterium]
MSSASIRSTGPLRRTRVLMDLARYKNQTARLDTADLDFGEFAHHRLSDEALRCLRYMHDVENHTVCYLRDLLVTSAHKDPAITSFLTFWNFEEFWHGEAIAAVLAAHGDEPEERVAATRRRLGWKDRLGPLAHLLGSSLAGESFIAIHMTWGAINEWTTQAGYARLAARAEHPLLSQLLGRIMRQEGRHIDFYVAEATHRLGDGRRAQRITRCALKHLWSPVGSSVMPASEVRFLVRYLFEGDDGRAMADRIDRRVDRLPGLAGLNLIGGALDGARP